MPGDYAALQALQAGLRRLGNGGARKAILDACAPILAAEIASGFQDSKDPTGKRWLPLAGPRRTPGEGGPLWLSGDLMAAASNVVITSDGFLVTSPLPYANRHLFGDKTVSVGRGRDALGRFTRARRGGGVPARPYLPTLVLPRRWQRPLDERALVIVRQTLGAT